MKKGEQLQMMNWKDHFSSPRFLCGGFLIAIFLIFSGFYFRSVMMPQYGWWQYYAWRMQEGEVLYKDLFLFMPPYFVLLTRLLYSFFGNHLMPYMLFVGLPVKLACLLLLYDILCRKTKPIYASVAVLTAACVSASYLMDNWYDYNPMGILPTLILAVAIMRFYEAKDNKARNIQASLAGLMSGVLLMYKQTLGIGLGGVALIMIVVLLYKEKKERKAWPILLFCLGTALGMAPGIIYISANHCWSEFWYCIGTATNAKGGMIGLITHFIGMLTQPVIWVAASACFFLLLICEKLWRGVKEPGLDNTLLDQNKKSYFKQLSLLILFLMLFTAAFTAIFDSYILHMGLEYLSGGIDNIIAALVVVSFLIVMCVLGIKRGMPERIIKRRGWIMAGIFIIAVLLWGAMPASYHQFAYEASNIFSVRRSAMNILVYLFLLLWGREMFRYFSNKPGEYSYLMFFTVICAHLLVCIISSSAWEEIFMLLYLPWPIIALLEIELPHKNLKNTAIYAVSLACILLCLSQKIYMPYDWQGWREPPIDETSTACTAEGLEGFKLSLETNMMYNDILHMIDAYTDEEDAVYQFGNMPLFNVLAQRKIPTYASIGWFDVCPDDIARQDAMRLCEDPPKIFIWHNMNEEEWDGMETLYRNGEASGQRSLRAFYDHVVRREYKMMARYDNHRDGHLEVWLRQD